MEVVETPSYRKVVRLSLQGLEHGGSERVVVHSQLLDLPILYEHGVALGAHGAQFFRGVKLHVERLCELALRVRQHAHLALGLPLLAPSRHDEGVVHGDARDHLRTRRLECLGIIDEARQVLLGASRREGAGHREEDALLALEELEHIHRLPWLPLIDINGRQRVSLCNPAGDQGNAALRPCSATQGAGEGAAVGRSAEEAPDGDASPNEQQRARG
mmetsp:Transcript_103204/g.220730  ORF Transcript_103204/g.220730 Transcript_103204/m.220730 type:complete len:216 (-) Transcript_103204:98-745(-)